MNKSKNFETYLKYFAVFEFELSKDMGKSAKFTFAIEISLFQIFPMLQ